MFKVTDCPEIHSNGFHLRFDKNCGPMGYILPHWTEDTRLLDEQLRDINQHRLDHLFIIDFTFLFLNLTLFMSLCFCSRLSWTTKISLPLRTESHQTRNLFHDVHPSLLLFLHRLRSITIYSQVGSRKHLHTCVCSRLSCDCKAAPRSYFMVCVQSEKRLVKMTRRDLSHSVLEVEHTEGTERWLVVKSTLKHTAKKVMHRGRLPRLVSPDHVWISEQ